MNDAQRGPLVLRTGTVPPAWIDYNEHMNAGYYAIAFDSVVDDFMDRIGLDAAYRALEYLADFARLQMTERLPHELGLVLVVSAVEENRVEMWIES